jgi:beta-1,2-mannobiose phosphorylase / 1,2-beta-oligomannan phosphorylase
MVEKMKGKEVLLLAFFLSVFLMECVSKKTKAENEFASEMVQFIAEDNKALFTGTGNPTWDKNIRERGFILKEDSLYHLWYTGFENNQSVMHLGYASSSDGINWKRYSANPIYDSAWVEDMSVVKSDSIYYMFAEGKDDIAHLLTSSDRINWTEKGDLDIRMKNGKPISKGPRGTPTIWKENGTWYLFYERGDLGIWLATSKDLRIWTNIQNEPVIKMGPDDYDKYAVAINQIVKYKGKYYGYYHASSFEDWRERTINVAISDDLIHWRKYPKNPILRDNKSSGIMVHDGQQYLLYSMHDKVVRHISKRKIVK